VVSARRSATVRFLVDTGATFAVIPPSLARRIGVALTERAFAVTLADGRRKHLRACTVGLRVGRREGPMTALVLSGSEPLLGVEALEGLGLRVDPSRGRLEASRSSAALLVGVRRG
jgi:clan AA aspartic protease